MKILILSGFFYPINTPRSFRTTELAKELVRQGHDVTVCIPKTDYNYCDFLNKYKIHIDFIDIDKPKDLNLKGNKINVLYKRVTNRIRSTYFCYPSIKYFWLIPKYLKTKGFFDAIISIAVPHPIHWGTAHALKKMKDKTKVWIADCGDPFMLCTTDTFKKPFYFKWFEKSFCRRADFITIPLESGKDGYYPEFRDKIKVIPQGFDFNEISIAKDFKENDIITFSYAGAFIPGMRDPRPVLEYLSKTKIDFRFYIYTNQPKLIESYKNILGDKLIISDYIERKELIYRMSTYDFLLNLENGTEVQAPSKLIDYGLAKRPVLSLYSQNLDEEKFNQFLNRNYNQKMNLPNINDYDIRNVTSSFIKLINQCIEK